MRAPLRVHCAVGRPRTNRRHAFRSRNLRHAWRQYTPGTLIGILIAPSRIADMCSYG
jgi:hypothetical protein